MKAEEIIKNYKTVTCLSNSLSKKCKEISLELIKKEHN